MHLLSLSSFNLVVGGQGTPIFNGICGHKQNLNAFSESIVDYTMVAYI